VLSRWPLAATDQPGQAGPLGLFVILLLAVATVLLIRSMSRHLRRLPASFDVTGPTGPTGPSETDDAPGPARPSEPDVGSGPGHSA